MKEPVNGKRPFRVGGFEFIDAYIIIFPEKKQEAKKSASFPHNRKHKFNAPLRMMCPVGLLLSPDTENTHTHMYSTLLTTAVVNTTFHLVVLTCTFSLTLKQFQFMCVTLVDVHRFCLIKKNLLP